MKENKYRPYKLQIKQLFLITDRQKRIDFSYDIFGKIQQNPNFIKNIVFSDEATFSMKDMFNR